MIKSLLLNSDNQIIAFIDERKVNKLLFKNKVEVLSVWEGRKIYSINGFIEYPAILRLKYHVALNATKLVFSRKLILRRDAYTCGYCKKKYDSSFLTIDHILPKSLGGESTFSNCVTACLTCNRKKANKTLEQSGMLLKINPIVPKKYLCYFPKEINWHGDWIYYV